MGPEDNPADEVQPTKEEYEAWEAEQGWDGCVGDESEGTCPACGAKLRFHQLFSDADEGINRCPDCGWEGGVQ